MLAARPATLPAAIVPVLVGTAAVIVPHGIRILPFLAALLASILIQVGTNLANDYFDFRKGADTAERLGPVRVTQAGLASANETLAATGIAFALATLCGTYLTFIGGWPILAIGALSILSGVAYTGGPWPLGYNGLGDIFVFLFFGLIAVVGSAYVQIGGIDPVAAVAAIPIGCTVTAILVVNNLRDTDTDRTAGKRTLSVRFGRRFARVEYAALVLGAYLFPPLLFGLGAIERPLWLPYLSLPLAIGLVRVVARSNDGRTLNLALKRTGQLHLFFGGFLALALAWPILIG